MSILITGGLGYIGSHTCVTLIKAGYEVLIVDNLSNSKITVLDKIEEITNSKVKFYQYDIKDNKKLDHVFLENNIEGVIHFAGYKAVFESVKNPNSYYENNIDSTLSLIKCMQEYNVKKMVFSSSATVYSPKNEMPLKETDMLCPTNPYGRTKWMIEKVLDDLYMSDNSWHIAKLRYFNPVGAIETGEIGEDPNGIPNNLMPYIAKVAVGELLELKIFGNDYNTVDGTGVRDYIHVMDLARGHLLAYERLEDIGCKAYNLGTGKGYSVLEMVEAYEKASGKKIPYNIVDRRAGDVPVCYADTLLAKKELGFVAEYDLDKMCIDSYNYQSKASSKMTLVIMAAGMGSRYGGLKQMDQIGPNKETLLDYAVYDAIIAGFSKVVFVIRKSFYEEFKTKVTDRFKDKIKVGYAFQEFSDIPLKKLLIEREKPLGTGHAVYCARNEVEGPFAVINADDFYGRDSFIRMAKFLKERANSNTYSMIGYRLLNTTSINGYVSRGICKTDENNILLDVVEREKIYDDGAIYYKENDKIFSLDKNSFVSMNFWGFAETFFEYLEIELVEFLNSLDQKDLKKEFYLPFCVNSLMKKGKINVEVIGCDEKWYGVTYAKDRETVRLALLDKTAHGTYPYRMFSYDSYFSLEICSEFDFEGEVISAYPYGDGHINDTLLVNTTEGINYIVQRINEKVFRNPVLLMKNIYRVTEHIRKKSDGEDSTLHIITTKDGKVFHETENNIFFRAYRFIDKATTYLMVRNEKDLENAGSALAEFQMYLEDFDASLLSDTIPDFHNTQKRFEHFLDVLNKDEFDRKFSSKKEIDFILKRKDWCSQIVSLLEKKDIPIRVTHNDTKFNNVMIHNETNRAVCLIDLDTVMKGSSLYDFGDAIRSSANKGLEDEENLDLVGFDIELFEAYTKGYLNKAKHFLNDIEKLWLARSAMLLTFECGMRFLTDYLEGDIYFKTSKDKHNLFRARTQFKMIEEMENELNEMERIVAKYII